MKRIGILTSGGDCQGLNAAIRGVAKALYEEFGDNVEIYGINDGYRGLIEGNYKRMKPENFSGILTLGGTILGTSRQPFKLMRVIDENSVDKVKNMKDNYKKMKLDCLVVLGGNGTHKTANLLSEEGLNVVSLPKTIDNDVWGTGSTARWISPPTFWTVSTLQLRPMGASLLSRSWGTRSVGSPCTRALQAEPT